MSPATVPDAVSTIWGIGLIVTLVVFVPLAVYSLHRTWRSARSIQRYAAETLQAAGRHCPQHGEHRGARRYDLGGRGDARLGRSRGAEARHCRHRARKNAAAEEAAML